MEPFYVYATYECQNNLIQLYSDVELRRDTVAILIVLIDFVVMFFFLGYLWTVQYLVKIDSERHRNLLFET